MVVFKAGEKMDELDRKFKQDSQKVVDTGKQAVKQVGKRAGKAVGKVAVKGAVKAGGAILAALGWPLIIIAIIIIIAILFIGAFYNAAPSAVMLDNIKMEQSDYDREIHQYAKDIVTEANTLETFLVPGEGSFYPKNGFSRLGRMADNNGLDIKIANQWGDAYSPALWKAMLDLGDNKLEDEKWTKKELKDNAYELRPFFYYKESAVTVCSVSEDGESSCETYIVHLLVEAFTIRGWNQYTYEWHTETYEDGGSITYERLSNMQSLDDGKDHLNTVLEEIVTDGEALSPDSSTFDDDISLELIWQNMLAYTAEAEWLAWLMESDITLLSTVSRAQIPSEFNAFLTEASEITGIPVHLLSAIIIKESSWNPLAINDSSGCFGLTQLHPDYFEAWCKRYGFDPELDKWNPRAQIIIGAQVFAGYMGQNQPDWEDKNWHKDKIFNSALAKYGGYGDKVDSAQSYIRDIVRIAEAYKNRETVWPVPGHYKITSGYGQRIHPITGIRGAHHRGVDIGAPSGAQVVSASAGVVTGVITLVDSYGKYVTIFDGTHTYLYAHLQGFAVKTGDNVMPGDTIGYVGSTGKSTGPHLHFEVQINGKDINPSEMLGLQPY